MEQRLPVVSADCRCRTTAPATDRFTHRPCNSSARCREGNRGWLPALLGATLVLSACGGDGTVTGETGGGAGEGEIPDTPSPVEPFVGLWDITGNWSGNPQVPQDEAILVVRPLNADGSADVVILDFDDGGLNCYYANNVTGTAEKSPIDGRVFLDDLYEFEKSVLALTDGGNTLTLQYADILDINGNGDTQELVTYQAPRIPGLTEADVELCDRGF